MNAPPPQRAWLLVKDKADGKRQAQGRVPRRLAPARLGGPLQRRRPHAATQVFRTQDQMLLDVNDSEIAFKEKGWVDPKK